MARLDPHSYADDQQAQTASLALVARVDFDARVLHGVATLTFRAPASGPLDLDTRDLAIDEVVAPGGAALGFVLHAADAVLGSRLTIDLPPATAAVTIRYRTSPAASALQWLTPAQTAGGQHPYLFSQCQAIHARSVVPLQDTPRLRLTYRAELTIPRALTAVMAAAHQGRDEAGDVAVERFEMPQPIPPYLLAFAIGDLAREDLSPRARVWAEPAVLARAAHEFAGVEQMLAAAEALFGPYDWERFDLLVMPPSFPYGGMENPRLTFLTPTLLAGDRSLVSVVAHELAHSWTGNLVTNASAEHFWLNEGFTVYAERRIVEALEGPELAALHAALGRRELDEALARFAERPELTHLRPRLDGVDPDDAYSQIPYEKGYALLCVLEREAGRPAFDAWLRRYLADFRFGAITTDDFLAHVAAHLPGLLERADAAAWIDGPGVPANAVLPRSARLEAIEALGARVPSAGVEAAWIPQEWQLYLAALPPSPSRELCEALDAAHGLTRRENHEILVDWLAVAIRAGHPPAIARAAAVLGEVGRMKYLRPLYTALAAAPSTRPLAHATYARARDGYHPIARQLVEGILRNAGASPDPA